MLFKLQALLDQEPSSTPGHDIWCSTRPSGGWNPLYPTDRPQAGEQHFP